MRATLSLRGLYRYAPTIFDELVLPEAVNRDDLIEALTLECADLEILYPQPEILRDAIGLWSRRLLPNWQKLAETLNYEYDPIANYDRTETHTRSTERTYNSEGSSTSTGSGSTTGSRNAYNSGWADQDRALSTNSGTVANEQAGEQAEDEDISIRAYGNIGVTTTQQMIEEQRRVVAYNLTEAIIDAFKLKFCLLIY